MKTGLIILLIFFSDFIQAQDKNNNLAITKPESIIFSQPLAQATKLIKPLCTKLSSQEINPPQIPGTKNRQVQLDCHGFEFAGKRRLAEFVFKDDELFLVWILVDATDLELLEKKMELKYNSATFNNSLFAAYTLYNTALRKDVPEVLFYAPEAAEQFEMWFQSANQ